MMICHRLKGSAKFLDIRTAQDAGELPVGGIASVTVMGDNFTNLGADKKCDVRAWFHGE